MERGGILQRMRAGGLVLALFALTLKAMLPPGFMLSAADGQVSVTLCSGATALLDLGHDGDGKSGQSAGQHCPFALAAAPALAEVAPAPAPPQSFGFVLDSAPLAEAAGVHDATGPPLPARGPPLNA